MKTTKKVLLIEDNPDHALLAKAAIQAPGGYEVFHASTGKQALETFENEKFDLALLDYVLPDMNGLTILKAFMEKRDKFPVIIMTGLGSEVVAVEAMKRGAYDYVIKSNDYFKILPLVIERAIEKYELVKLSEEFSKKLEDKTAEDALTGVYNKNYFYEFYARELDIARRYGRRLALAVIEVKNFDHIRASYGIKVAESVLVHVALILRKNTRSSDVVARFTGNEFVVVMLEASLADANSMIARVQDGIERFNVEKKLPVEISLNSGASSGNVDDLLEQATKKMYETKQNFYYAKRSGRL